MEFALLFKLFWLGQTALTESKQLKAPMRITYMPGGIGAVADPDRHRASSLVKVDSRRNRSITRWQ